MSKEVPLSQLSQLELSVSVFDQVSPLSDEEIENLFLDVEPNHESDNDGRVSQDAASAFSNYSTPVSTSANRPATTFATAKKWLTAWLKEADLYHCPVTLTPIVPTRVNQMAHIMLPQSAPPNAVKLVARILAMTDKEMCIHSRLFFMPLRSDVHSLVDMHRLALMVSKEILKLLTKYLNRPFGGMEEKSDWSELRKGSLDEFTALKDGTVYDCTLLCSPHFEDQHRFNSGDDTFRPRYPNFPPVRTHVSPFALAFHALRVLDSTASPMKFNFEHIFRARTLQEINQIRVSLERALLGIKSNDEVQPTALTQEMRDHTDAFMEFVLAFHTRCATARAIINQKPPKSAQSGGSGSYRRGSFDESSHRSHHSYRSHPNPPSTPTPAPSIHSQTRSRTNVRRTPASDVREEYLAALSLSSFHPHYPSSHAPILALPDATKLITQPVLDSASNSPSSSVSSGFLADSPAPLSFALARPPLFKRLIRTASRWIKVHRGNRAVKGDHQIATDPHVSWSSAAPARVAAARG
ncbi:hypothetical protein BDP27DRAFT_1337258 [Rhodocollybia butyracea]|uniref:Uncharacterized protein n=1 Tax=Rhodocollybia butyracea TaxID=206335 RepID=A0A9P5PBI8_9AGAR|nr:hypothetical protein BDP27DRAFT_1337258 [Rhodocollybia butyracea]